MSSNDRLLGAALVLGFALAGCPKPPVAPPLDFGPRGRITDPKIAFDAVLSRHAAMKSITGEAKLAIDTPQGGGKITELVAAEKPAKLRLDSVSTFGPLATLVSDGETYRLADFEHRKFYEGPATAEGVSRLLPVRVPPEELVSLLLGVPPLLPGAEPVRITVDEQHATYVLTLAGNGDVERLSMDPLTLRTLQVEIDDRPALGGYRATFNDFETDLDLPKIVKVSTPDGKSSLELKWREREPNAAIEAATWALPVPEGFERAP